MLRERLEQLNALTRRLTPEEAEELADLEILLDWRDRQPHLTRRALEFDFELPPGTVWGHA